MVSTKTGLPIMRIFRPLRSSIARDRLLAVVDVAASGVHPAQADQAGGRMVGQLLEQLVADRTVDHLLHVRVVAEHERQVEHVDLRHDRAHRADADARDRKRADLRLLDHLLLAAELHRRIHLHAQPAAGRCFELLAHAHDRLDRRIAERMHVGRLQHELLLGESGLGEIYCRCAERRDGAEAEHGAAIHAGPPSMGAVTSALPLRERATGVDPAAGSCYATYHII